MVLFVELHPKQCMLLFVELHRRELLAEDGHYILVGNTGLSVQLVVLLEDGIKNV